jgi:hypothetical protein
MGALCHSGELICEDGAMLKMLSLAVLAVGFLAADVSAGYAHSGGTDKNGCHMNRKTGVRHCH